MIAPGYYPWCHVSYMQSPYSVWFYALGYPELDILEHKDGSWSIIQFYNSPVIPSMKRWQQVLGPMENVEKSYGFCAKYTSELDMHKRVFRMREEAKTKQVEDEHAALEKHRDQYVDIAHKAITKNPLLMERIAKNGVQEMDLGYIAKNVPKSELVKPKFKGKEVLNVSTVHNPSIDTNQAVSAQIPE